MFCLVSLLINERDRALEPLCTVAEAGPLPPHISLEQAKSFMASMVKGNSDARHTIGQSIKQMSAGFL